MIFQNKQNWKPTAIGEIAFEQADKHGKRTGDEHQQHCAGHAHGDDGYQFVRIDQQA